MLFGLKRLLRQTLERRIATLLLAVMGLLPFALKLASPMVGDPTPGTILVIGDLSSIDTPASQVRLGLEDRKRESYGAAPGMKIKPVDESRILRQNSPDLESDIEHLVIDAMASEPIVAAVICSTSKTSSVVLKVVSTLNRPSLVAVASQDELLAKPFADHSAIRLIPSNRQEGITIAERIMSEPSKCVAVFTDSSAYAAQIADAMYDTLWKGHHLKPVSFYTFGHLPSVSDIRLAAGQSDWIVAIGYDDLIKQVTRTLTSGPTAQKAFSGKLLFADSAIPLKAELTSLPDVEIVFPFNVPTASSKATPEPGELENDHTYFTMGRNCLELLLRARASCGWRTNIKHAFIDYWTRTAERQYEGQSYLFEESGESLSARWLFRKVNIAGRLKEAPSP